MLKFRRNRKKCTHSRTATERFPSIFHGKLRSFVDISPEIAPELAFVAFVATFLAILKIAFRLCSNFFWSGRVFWFHFGSSAVNWSGSREVSNFSRLARKGCEFKLRGFRTDAARVSRKSSAVCPVSPVFLLICVVFYLVRFDFFGQIGRSPVRWCRPVRASRNWCGSCTFLMDGEDVLLLLKYPTILAKGPQEWAGYLPVNDADYEIHFKIKNSNQVEVFKPDLNLKNDLMRFDGSVSNFLDKVKATVAAKITPKKIKKQTTDLFKHILCEYAEFREFYIGVHKSEISQNLSTIKIINRDDCNREHEISISVDYNSPNCFTVSECRFSEFKFEATNSLKKLYEQFSGVVNGLQPFFKLMDEIGANSWVLDPEIPTYKEKFRRISLVDKASVTLTFDPWNVAKSPDVKFLGPETVVEKLRGTLIANLENWDPNTDQPFDEILKLLGLQSFPRRNTDAVEVFGGTSECYICFSLRMNGKVSEIVCPNDCCKKLYHEECLYQWFTSVNARRSFNEICGQCPNCEKALRCLLPH